MTPQEKQAKELFDKFYVEHDGVSPYVNDDVAKKHALTCIDELIKRERMWIKETGKEKSDNWFIEVKQEIEKL